MLKVSQEQARNFILCRQGLVKPYDEPLDAVHAVVAVQTQYAGSLVPAVLARSKKMNPSWSQEVLQEERTLIKSWSLRKTVHTANIYDHRLLVTALGEDFGRSFMSWLSRSRTVTLEDHAKVELEILKALQDGPLTRSDIHERVPILKGLEGAGWGLDVMSLAYKGKIVFAEQGGAKTQFVLLESWSPLAIPTPNPDSLSELFTRYLCAHSPATLQDFMYWTGMPMSKVRLAFEAVQDKFIEVEIEGKKGKHYICDTDVKALQAPVEKAPVRLLAKFDPLVMGWKDKSLFLSPADASRVIRPAGQIEATVLVAGRIAATWRLQRAGKKLVFSVDPFKPLKVRAAGAVEKEAARLAKALGFKDIEVIFKPN